MKYCNVRTEYRSTPAPAVIGLTMLLRTGRRPFRGWDSGSFKGSAERCRAAASLSLIPITSSPSAFQQVHIIYSFY